MHVTFLGPQLCAISYAQKLLYFHSSLRSLSTLYQGTSFEVFFFFCCQLFCPTLPASPVLPSVLMKWPKNIICHLLLITNRSLLLLINSRKFTLLHLSILFIFNILLHYHIFLSSSVRSMSVLKVHASKQFSVVLVKHLLKWLALLSLSVDDNCKQVTHFPISRLCYKISFFLILCRYLTT